MQGRKCLHCHYLAILLILTDYPDTGVADGFAISTASEQWSERFTYQSEPAFVIGCVAVEMLVYNMLDEVADAVAGTAEESGDALHAVKRVIADCNLMLVVLAKLNQREVCLSVIFEVAFALLCGGTGGFGLSGFALSGDWLDIGVDGIFHSFGKI